MTPLIVALAVVVGAPATKDKPKNESPSLVGEWVPTKAVRGGKLDNAPPGTRMIFKADGKALFKDGNRDKIEEGAYKIDPKKKPAEIDIFPPATEKDVNVVGIYKFEKGKLILCLAMGGSRPKKFASPDGSQIMLITLERAKKD